MRFVAPGVIAFLLIDRSTEFVCVLHHDDCHASVASIFPCDTGIAVIRFGLRNPSPVNSERLAPAAIARDELRQASHCKPLRNR